MLKSKKSVGALMLATIISVGAVMSTTALVSAGVDTSGKKGEVIASYDNRTMLPDDNGQYGMIIPTAITFTDQKVESDATVSIIGINGFDLDQDWDKLEVLTTVKSENAYKLKLKNSNANAIDYRIRMDKNAKDFEANTSEQQLAQSLGVNVPGIAKEAPGKAFLKKGKYQGNVKGRYTDTLKYKFTEKTNESKNHSPIV